MTHIRKMLGNKNVQTLILLGALGLGIFLALQFLSGGQPQLSPDFGGGGGGGGPSSGGGGPSVFVFDPAALTNQAAINESNRQPAVESSPTLTTMQAASIAASSPGLYSGYSTPTGFHAEFQRGSVPSSLMQQAGVSLGGYSSVSGRDVIFSVKK